MPELICIITLSLVMIVWHFIINELDKFSDICIHHSLLMICITGIAYNVFIQATIYPAIICLFYLCFYFYSFFIIPFIDHIDEE